MSDDEKLTDDIAAIIDMVSVMTPDQKRHLDYVVERAEIKKERDELLAQVEQLKAKAAHLTYKISELDRQYMESTVGQGDE
jgi:uncharacterized protein YeeX (DUF496 family)